MTLDKIQKLVNSINKTIEDNQKIATPVLAVKLAKCLEAYPHDQTLGSMSRVIEKMASNNTIFITRNDLRSLYNKLYSANTKFAELFEDELGKTELKSPIKEMVKDDSVELNPYKVSDPILSNALNSVFDRGIPLKMYSQDLANKALKSVAGVLDIWNLKPSSLNVDSGNEKFLVIKAGYETPKGLTSFYVPVEVKNNNIIQASIFVGNKGPQDLNNINIKNYLIGNTGVKLNINSALILDVLTKSAEEKREMSGAELALTKLNAIREGKAEFFGGQIVGQKVAEASVKDVQLPKMNEFESFEKQFTTPYGMATFKFGEDKVKAGNSVIARELISIGYKNPQVVVSGNDDSNIFYSVALNGGRLGFTVPVKIVNNKVVKPELMICNGKINELSLSGISKLNAKNESDYKAAASASPLFGLKPADLIENIKKAFMDNNYSKAEDALNILASSGNEKEHAIGFKVYMDGLAGNRVEAEVSKCSMVIESKHSQHKLCGHTGLPLHKVYQDKYGNCLPLYRRGMDENYEASAFMTAKILG